MEFSHIPIMLQQCLDGLDSQNKKNAIFVDGTLGGGGHSNAILETSDKTTKLIGVDRDKEAIAAANKRLERFKERFVCVNNNFFNIKEILKGLNIKSIDGMLLDLGVSSYQLDNPERGFSYNKDAHLDMRMDVDNPKNAYCVINGYSKEKLTQILRDYSEEKWASRIAEFIVKKREESPIETTFELVEIIKAAIPASARREGGHPAKRTFQGIRIEVNGELEELERAIVDIIDSLSPKGRLAIITFHSLEDRIVKKIFQKLENPCDCPPKAPICICNKKPIIKRITRTPIVPTEKEVCENKRAKSAKLRVCEKL